MAKKTGVINSIDKHDELTRAEITVIEKQLEIRRFRKKRKVYTISTTKGVVEITDPKKREAYNNSRCYV